MGRKQLEAVGPSGEIIMDYSIHYALEAGFKKIVVVIRKDLEKDFKEIIGNRIEKLCYVKHVFQESLQALRNQRAGQNSAEPDKQFFRAKALLKNPLLSQCG